MKYPLAQKITIRMTWDDIAQVEQYTVNLHTAISIYWIAHCRDYDFAQKVATLLELDYHVPIEDKVSPRRGDTVDR